MSCENEGCNAKLKAKYKHLVIIKLFHVIFLFLLEIYNTLLFGSLLLAAIFIVVEII